MKNGVYVVTGDAGDLDGWAPEQLADALIEPLGNMGISVECVPNQFGGGGYVPTDESVVSRSDVVYIVEKIIQGDE